MINWNNLIEAIFIIAIYETWKFFMKIMIKSFKEMVPDVTTKPFEKFNFNKPAAQPTKPENDWETLVKYWRKVIGHKESLMDYELMKQDQWDMMCKHSDFKSDDSISLIDQIKRLEEAKNFWVRKMISFKRNALMEETNEGFMSYQHLIHDAALRIKRYEKQIDHLNAFKDIYRKVGNYEKNNT